MKEGLSPIKRILLIASLLMTLAGCGSKRNAEGTSPTTEVAASCLIPDYLGPDPENTPYHLQSGFLKQIANNLGVGSVKDVVISKLIPPTEEGHCQVVFSDEGVQASIDVLQGEDGLTTWDGEEGARVGTEWAVARFPGKKKIKSSGEVQPIYFFYDEATGELYVYYPDEYGIEGNWIPHEVDEEREKEKEVREAPVTVISATATPVPTQTSTPGPTATSTHLATSTIAPYPTSTLAPTSTRTPIPKAELGKPLNMSDLRLSPEAIDSLAEYDIAEGCQCPRYDLQRLPQFIEVKDPQTGEVYTIRPSIENGKIVTYIEPDGVKGGNFVPYGATSTLFIETENGYAVIFDPRTQVLQVH